MRRENYGLYGVALAIVVVGALWVGLPVGSLAVFGLIVMCPLMMFFMMRGMGSSGHERHDSSTGSLDPHNRNNVR